MKKYKIILLPLLVFLFMGLSHNTENVFAASDITTTATNKLGKLKNKDVKIYQELENQTSYQTAGAEYTNLTYYIKKQATMNESTYYFISKNASSTEEVGWVKSTDVKTYNHNTVDKKQKTFYMNGTGKGYSKPWGGSKEVIHNDLSPYMFAQLKVNRTEKVGANTWYRGTLNGKTIWVHSSYVSSTAPTYTNISRLGQLKAGAIIYKKIDDGKPYDATTYQNTVYYIKQQAKFGDVLYYLISSKPSKTTGVIGWVKSTELKTYEHKSVDRKEKTFYVNGKGKGYNRAWGGTKNVIFNEMSPYLFTEFKVNLTEKVGANTWYRGTLNGKTTWLHSSSLFTGTRVTSNTSRLGQLKSNATIYNKIGPGPELIDGNTYLNSVYYIKQQTSLGNDLYYLISTKPSKTSGVIGWVKSTELKTYAHKTVDKTPKTFYIKGSGKAYSKIWGGSNEVKYNLSSYRFAQFDVNLTERVGNNVWYRGVLNGKTVWIHSSYLVNRIEYSDTSRLGLLKSSATIYNKLEVGATKIAPTEYLNSVYYIKQQAKFGSDVYYLISKKPSKTSGIIGWVKNSEITNYSHKTISSQKKTLYIMGKGSAYSKPMGGSKDVVYKDLSSYTNAVFAINLTEKVGTVTWYRGVLDGKTVWIEHENLKQFVIKYSNYSLTLSQALTLQMKVKPQTDKYRNSAAYVSSGYVKLTQGGTVSAGVELRTSPKSTITTNIDTKVKSASTVTILDTNVTGTKISNSTKWYKIKYSGKELYVHSSLVKLSPLIGTATADLNVRSDQSTSSHIYGGISEGTTFTVYEKGSEWHSIAFDTWRNASNTDTKYYLNPLNFMDDAKQKFQFLDLSMSSNVTASKLNSYLSNKGILENLGSSFIEAGNKYEVNELYLLSHALLETGNGTSALAKGVKHNGVTVYNMYGIGAYDSCALTCGAEKAYTEGWTTPQKAIVGGAKFIANDYIHSASNQNTLYKMRWNPEGMVNNSKATHQYATDIGWAYKQINSIYNLYQELGINHINLDIPVYK